MVSKTNKVGAHYKSLLDDKDIAYADVSRLAGVSQKTVDIFLNDRNTIAPKSLSSILNAIDKLLNSKQAPQNPSKSFLVSEVDRIMNGLPQDMQLIIFDHVRSLEILNMSRPPRVHN